MTTSLRIGYYSSSHHVLRRSSYRWLERRYSAAACRSKRFGYRKGEITLERKELARAFQLEAGAIIRAHRKRAGLTIVQLANLVGVTHGHISLAERGKVNLSVPTLFEVAIHCKIPIRELFDCYARAKAMHREQIKETLLDELSGQTPEFLDKLIGIGGAEAHEILKEARNTKS